MEKYSYIPVIISVHVSACIEGIQFSVKQIKSDFFH